MRASVSMKGKVGRLSQMLKSSVGIPESDDGPSEENWAVGGRYQVLTTAALHARPDLSREKVGQIRAKDCVLLLALQSVQAELSGNGEAKGEVLLAYVANTKTSDWTSGWALLEGGADAPQVIRKRRLPGSWEVGGRYIVNGSPVLRGGIELESDQICEMLPNDEVLVLDLGLVIRAGEPRLRARVRVDSGDEGWLTIELPGGSALLDPLNLYSAEALQRKGIAFGEKHRKNQLSKRLTVNGQVESSNQAWEVGGKYRLVERVVVHEEVELDSRVIGELRKGSLVTVQGLEHLQQQGEPAVLRLQISNEHTDAIGWLSPLSQNGEKLLDSRDHLEYEKLVKIMLQAQESVAREQDLAAGSSRAVGEAAGEDWEEPVDSESQNPMGMQSPSDAADASRDDHDTAYSSKNDTFAPEVSQENEDSPNIALMSDHVKSGEAEVIHVESKSSPSQVARHWAQNAGPSFNEMDAEKDEKHVQDNLENEGYGSICCSRNGGLLNCGATRMWSSSPNGPSSYEPAPEPRPCWPPGAHPAATPSNYPQ